jgi:hypothetical protein
MEDVSSANPLPLDVDVREYVDTIDGAHPESGPASRR